MKKQQLPEPSSWDYTVMETAGWAVYTKYINRYQDAGKMPVEQQDGYIRHLYDTRYWWVSRYFQSRAKRLHPVVDKFRKQWRPLDWQQLMFEHPYQSESFPDKIAYTPNERYGQDDRQLVTSIGKYLNKHWPHVPDHLRRDAVAAFTFDEMSFGRTMPEIIQGIEMGPRSCMQSGYGSIPFNSRDLEAMIEWFKDNTKTPPRWGYHPYSVYDPAYGWHMAVRKKDGMFLGRALCLTHEGSNVFVRSYSRRSDEDSSSSSDHMLEQWLQGQGYEKRSGWPDGAKFKRIAHPTKSGLMMPYLDGADSDYRTVRDEGDYLVMEWDGPITCDNTDGTVENSQDEDSIGDCVDCGASVREDDDDRIWAGRSEEDLVCSSCMSGYTYVRGSGDRWARYREYYIPDSDAETLQCGSYSVDPDHLPPGVVELEDGDYAELDDCVCIDDEYYLSDDEDVIEMANEWDGERYNLKDNCWQCTGSQNWYHGDDTDDQVEVDGEYYHRDHLSELVNARQVPLPIDEPPAPTPEPALVTGDWGNATTASTSTTRSVTLEDIRAVSERLVRHAIHIPTRYTTAWSFDPASAIGD